MTIPNAHISVCLVWRGSIRNSSFAIHLAVPLSPCSVLAPSDEEACEIESPNPPRSGRPSSETRMFDWYQINQCASKLIAFETCTHALEIWMNDILLEMQIAEPRSDSNHLGISWVCETLSFDVWKTYHADQLRYVERTASHVHHNRAVFHPFGNKIRYRIHTLKKESEQRKYIRIFEFRP